MGIVEASRAAEGVLIKPRFVQGDKQYIEVVREVKQKMSGPQAPGGGVEFTLRRLYLVAREVESVKAQSVGLGLRFERASQAMDSMMGELFFDTDDPDNEDAAPQLGSALKPMIGMPMKLRLDSTGQVASFSGMTAIREKVEEAVGGNPMMGMLLSELSDERGRVDWGEQMFLLYPNKEVAPGDTWKKSIHDTLPRIGKVVTDYECKFDRLTQEAGRKVAVIAFTAKMSRDPGDKAGSEGSRAEATLEGRFNGTAMFDIEAGQIVKRVQEGKMKLRVGSPRADAARAKKRGEEAEDAEEDDADEAAQEPPVPEMTIDLAVKQTTTLMSETQQKAKRAAEARKRAADAKDDDDDDEHDDAPSGKAGKSDEKKPEKKRAGDDDDDDDD